MWYASVRSFMLATVSFCFIHSTSSQADFIPITGWDAQLFPSFLVATATLRLSDSPDDQQDTHRLGDGHGVLGVRVESPAADTSIVVKVTSEDLLDSSTFTGTLANEGETYDIYPQIKYHYDSLIGNKQSVPVPVTFEVTLGDEDPIDAPSFSRFVPSTIARMSSRKGGIKRSMYHSCLPPM